MLLSVVVPVHNVERYLRQCIDSIIKCNLVDMEIIMVDDGSTDGSNAICREYTRKYDFCQLIYQENQGLSAARNRGLSAATGEYIVFFDSDDRIISNLFTKTVAELVNTNREIDILLSGFWQISNQGKLIHQVTIEKSEHFLYGTTYMEKNVRSLGGFWYIWRFIFKRVFLLNNRLRFKPEYLCEDIDFAVQALIRTSHIACYHNPYYCYRLGREASIMSMASMKRISDYLEITAECIATLQKYSYLGYTTAMTDRLVLEYVLNLPTIYEVARDEWWEAERLFSQKQHLLLRAQVWQCRCVRKLIAFTGIKRVAFLLFLVKKARRLARRISEPFRRPVPEEWAS